MITINYGYKVNAKESIDVRLILTKAEMLACSGTRPTYALPDIYFALCSDDGYFYRYDVNTEQPSEETGKFTRIDYLRPIDRTELEALIAAEETRAKGVESGLDDRIKNLEARGRFLSSWNCATGLPETEPTYTPYTYKSGDYYIISNVVGSELFQPEGTSYTGVASTTPETREVAAGDYYNYDGTKWIWIQNTQKTVTFAQIGGDADDNSNLHTKLDTIRQSVVAEKQRAEDVEGDLQAAITAEVNRATAAEAQLTADLAEEVASRKEIDRQLQVAITDEYDRAVAAEDQLSADIAAEQNARASADLALQANIDAEVERAKAAEATKTTQEITNANGKALILNEKDGGGIFFEKNDGTSKSFIGVNDSTEGGPDAQIYAIDPSNSNAGAKIDILKDGIYYTVGSEPYISRIVEDNLLVTKKDLAASGKVKDVQVEGVSVLDQSTGIANITDRASKAELEAEVTRAKAAEALKTDTKAVGDNGTAYIFNEKDGGGAKFENNSGVESFVGVNDGGTTESGLAAQIYADKYVDGKWQGAKLDVTNNGMYYTVGNKSFAERAIAENELATKGNIATEKERAEAIEASLNQTISNEVSRATDVEGVLRYDITDLQTNKLNLVPLEPSSGYPYHFVYGMGATPAEEKLTLTLNTLTLDNAFTEMQFSADIPGATTATAGLLTATDKGRVDNALQSTDTLILDCDFLD